MPPFRCLSPAAPRESCQNKREERYYFSALEALSTLFDRRLHHATTLTKTNDSFQRLEAPPAPVISHSMKQLRNFFALLLGKIDTHHCPYGRRPADASIALFALMTLHQRLCPRLLEKLLMTSRKREKSQRPAKNNHPMPSLQAPSDRSDNQTRCSSSEQCCSFGYLAATALADH
jgi:hypothetical protein